jgi:hypothetical protein
MDSLRSVLVCEQNGSVNVIAQEYAYRHLHVRILCMHVHIGYLRVCVQYGEQGLKGGSPGGGPGGPGGGGRGFRFQVRAFSLSLRSRSSPSVQLSRFYRGQTRLVSTASL